MPWLLLSRRSSGSGTSGAAVGLLATGGIGAISGASPVALAAGGATAAAGLSFGSFALVFLKVGAVLYGSGYVLVAFLEGERYGLNMSSEL